MCRIRGERIGPGEGWRPAAGCRRGEVDLLFDGSLSGAPESIERRERLRPTSTE